MKPAKIPDKTVNSSRKCIICGSADSRFIFEKGHFRKFSLFRCNGCGLEFLHPVPSEEELNACYNGTYFTERTDRGYNNYFSAEVKNEIERVFRLNLRDLGFEKLNLTIGNSGRSLDIGCAAGYFVNYMKQAGWDSNGIDVSEQCTDFAKEKLHLNVANDSYLKKIYTGKFDLITMWATIEHLNCPDKFIKKTWSDLKDGGHLYISTCRTGIWNFKIFFSSDWRYYNFPEHLFFFRKKNIMSLLRKNGFHILKYRTYGSGMNPGKKRKKMVCDFLARHFGLGDMMIISAIKKGKTNR